MKMMIAMCGVRQRATAATAVGLTTRQANRTHTHSFFLCTVGLSIVSYLTSSEAVRNFLSVSSISRAFHFKWYSLIQERITLSGHFLFLNSAFSVKSIVVSIKVCKKKKIFIFFQHSNFQSFVLILIIVFQIGFTISFSAAAHFFFCLVFPMRHLKGSAHTCNSLILLPSSFCCGFQLKTSVSCCTITSRIDPFYGSTEYSLIKIFWPGIKCITLNQHSISLTSLIVHRPLEHFNIIFSQTISYFFVTINKWIDSTECYSFGTDNSIEQNWNKLNLTHFHRFKFEIWRFDSHFNETKASSFLPIVFSHSCATFTPSAAFLHHLVQICGKVWLRT